MAPVRYKNTNRGARDAAEVPILAASGRASGASHPGHSESSESSHDRILDRNITEVNPVPAAATSTRETILPSPGGSPPGPP